MRHVICKTQEEALDLLHHCLEQGDVVLTRHFREELAAERLNIEDAWCVMRSGAVYEAPELDIKSGDWKWKVEGREPNGNWLVIVFTFKTVARTFLITVYSVDQKG